MAVNTVYDSQAVHVNASLFPIAIKIPPYSIYKCIRYMFVYTGDLIVKCYYKRCMLSETEIVSPLTDLNQTRYGS